MTTTPRQPLPAIAEYLTLLEAGALEGLVRRRLFREPVPELPPLGRDEDPADVFVDVDGWLRERNHSWAAIRNICASLAEQWAKVPYVRQRPEPLGELHYLCARIAAVEARGAIAGVAEREDLRGVLLPGGEDIQLRALRCLAGLLVHLGKIEQMPFLPVFERALKVSQHRPMALTALVAFDPPGREQYIRRTAAQSESLEMNGLLSRLDWNVRMLQQGAGGSAKD